MELSEEAQIPFYTKAAALDDYIRSPDARRGAEILDAVLDIIRTRKELRDYFFRSRPHPAWAYLLWEAGFFERPPEPRQVDDNHIEIPPWDAQIFLLSVAPYVTEVVIKHVDSIARYKYYVRGAVEALCLIPVDIAETRTESVATWLDTDDVWPGIMDVTVELIERLAGSGKYDSALRLFDKLAEPIPSSNVEKLENWTMNAEARSKLRFGADEARFLERMQGLFSDAVPEQLTAMLERHLCAALHLEAEVANRPELEFEGRWRAAIEQSGQDLESHYRDYLLIALRDTVDSWAGRNPSAVRPTIERYLSGRRVILRRLALYLLSRSPKEYEDLAARELRNAENLDDTDIHHEILQLLRRGYPMLPSADQQEVLALIRNGPALEALRTWLDDSGKTPESVESYLDWYSQTWIRDRLWMIKDALDTEAAQFLERLVAEQGEPEHPDFLSWSSSSFSFGSVRKNTSPMQAELIAARSPAELVEFLRDWHTDQNVPSDLGQPSFRDLGAAVASAISRDLQRYSDKLEEIGLLRPEFASALIDRLLRHEPLGAEAFEVGLDLCEQLLNDETFATALTRTTDLNWVEVRRLIARALNRKLEEREKCPIGNGSLLRVRDLLLRLIRDPDHGPTANQADQDGYNDALSNTDEDTDDPLTISMRRVRPIAIGALIELELCRVIRLPNFSADDKPGPPRFDSVVREALTYELQEDHNPGCVHSVYGRQLVELNWLDEEWTRVHLDDIFPTGDSSEVASRFVAAWEAFMWRNRGRIHQPLFEALRPKYSRAIENLRTARMASKRGYPAEGLVQQLVWEFLWGDYDIVSDRGEETLLAEFFRKVPAEARSNAAWIIWRVWTGCPEERVRFWPRIRMIWEWRVAESSRLNHPIDLDYEMAWYARLAPLAPDTETLATLWPLLEGLLPHLRGARSRHLGWLEVMRYLATEIDRDRIRAIRMFRLFCSERPPFFDASSYDHEHKIIETALAFSDSRAEALEVIDLIARGGSDRYRDLYEKYAGAPPARSR